VSAIICERGIIRPVDQKEIEKMLSGI